MVPGGRAASRWFRTAATAAPLLLAVACGGEAPKEEPQGAPPDTPGAAAAGASAFPGTPPGGIRDWVADIRRGLEGLAGRVAEEPEEAERQVLDLYLGRQEYIERYYGRGGPYAATESLEAAVLEAEARFHELMRMTGRRPPPDSAVVAGAVDSLLAQLDRVLREARKADVPLEPAAAGGPGPGTGGGEDDTAPPGLTERLRAIEAGLTEVERAAAGGREGEVRRAALRLYLDDYEPVEGLFGPGAPYGAPPLAGHVADGEEAFHALMRAGAEEVGPAVAALRREVRTIRTAAAEAGVPLRPEIEPLPTPGSGEGPEGAGASGAGPEPGGLGDSRGARSAEVSAILRELREARGAYAAGDPARALERIEHAYLEGFEPLEPRLSAERVRRVERLFHLHLRPGIARGVPPSRVEPAFASLEGELRAADDELSAGHSFWFGAFNAFAIIFREGLEAVLLIGAILAYLGRVSDDPRHRRHVYRGLGLGILASLGTWAAARTLVPLGGAGRELIEGITALLAVVVLVYVSNWLFQKTYVHDWKEYLENRVGRAVTAGSALAMASLAFAAVYREGFETVLFYQALLFDVGAGALLAGFLPGLLLIAGVGIAIIRLGLRLPLRRLFAVTNVVLLYLAFVFVGKGIYNLQEAGLFSPHPLSAAPDHEALRQLLGVFPLAETLLAQAAFLALVLASYLFYRSRAGRAAGKEPAGRAAGKEPAREAGRPRAAGGEGRPDQRLASAGSTGE